MNVKRNAVKRNAVKRNAVKRNAIKRNAVGSLQTFYISSFISTVPTQHTTFILLFNLETSKLVLVHIQETYLPTVI